MKNSENMIEGNLALEKNLIKDKKQDIDLLGKILRDISKDAQKNPEEFLDESTVPKGGE